MITLLHSLTALDLSIVTPRIQKLVISAALWDLGFLMRFIHQIFCPSQGLHFVLFLLPSLRELTVKLVVAMVVGDGRGGKTQTINRQLQYSMINATIATIG